MFGSSIAGLRFQTQFAGLLAFRLMAWLLLMDDTLRLDQDLARPPRSPRKFVIVRSISPLSSDYKKKMV
ncbi:hypothetical protein HBI56_077800 [Parastagonospora nodorum]|nr:hypothetical protein HBH56_149380 [Parastagonospora nodorum]KAH3928651.1 hypothetical protein HBH54_135280 [Parastagonospora nodorum]KAH3945864.1 hypothetical protein HBH53_136830 [Parastagonospora nodorum]KAH3983606.1 hypothetical protein HBH52_063180 [Parastagonospora nodorum]KAH3985567.1 hypothetical protein HBH51_021950 [Parastagonospora nodorum]